VSEEQLRGEQPGLYETNADGELGGCLHYNDGKHHNQPEKVRPTASYLTVEQAMYLAELRRLGWEVKAGAYSWICEPVSLARQIMAVARIELSTGYWAAYIGVVLGDDHTTEWEGVARNGTKLPEEVARPLFSTIAELFNWRD